MDLEYSFVLFCIMLTVVSCANDVLLTDFFPQNGLCGLSSEERKAVLSTIQLAVELVPLGYRPVPECGPGLWFPVADVDVTGDDTTCPGEWTFLSFPRIGCTRPDSGSGGCVVASFSPPDGREYSRVCGRTTGVATGNPNAFERDLTELGVVDGVTITYASRTQHIWSFAVGGSWVVEPDEVECPCDPRC